MLSHSTRPDSRSPIAERDQTGRHYSDIGEVSWARQRSNEAAPSETRGDSISNRWTTLAEYLTYLEKRGIPQNVASFIGAVTIREHVIGLEDKQPTPAQLEQMRELVRREMEAGALGITTALIYPPAFFAKTEELIEMCKVAAKTKAVHHAQAPRINQFIESGRTILISREAECGRDLSPHGIGRGNWPQRISVPDDPERAKPGLKIPANMYTYPAGGTGLNASMPPGFGMRREAGYKRFRG